MKGKPPASQQPATQNMVQKASSGNSNATTFQTAPMTRVRSTQVLYCLYPYVNHHRVRGTQVLYPYVNTLYCL